MKESMMIDEKSKVVVLRDDRISELPDDIIVHILSLLPVVEAAATSVVSRRWIDLWKYGSNLRFKFSYKPSSVDANINLVNSALKSHKALVLKEFKIDFHVTESKQHHVAKWLEYVFSKGVERVDLNLGYDGPVVRGGNAVLDLEMVRTIVNSNFKSSLKVLCLRCIQVSGDAIALLVRHCKLLERLLIFGSKRRSDVEVGGPSLKHLDMRSRIVREPSKILGYDCIEEKYNIKVCAPNLTWLTIDQNSERVFLDNVPKLVNMNFYYRFEFGDTLHHFANVAAQLQTLIIHIYDPMVTFSVPEMPKLKKLVIYFRTIFKRVVPLPVTRFLSASPCLEEFKIEISELCFGFGPNSRTIQYLPDIFEIPKVGGGCRHEQLKVFVLSGYCGVDRIGHMDFGHCRLSLELVRYIVDNCVGLEEIVIGQCDRVGLVRDIVDYDEEPLDHYFIEPGRGHYRFVATAQQRQAFEKLMQMQHIPPHIKLRIVYEDTTKKLGFQAPEMRGRKPVFGSPGHRWTDIPT